MRQKIKRYGFVLGFFLLVVACKENTRTGLQRLKPSHGELNQLTLIVDDTLWISNTGDSIRKYLAAPIDGIVPEEPLFVLEQFSSRTFVDKNKLARNLIVFSNKGNRAFTLERSKYATPQNVFSISGRSMEEMVEVFVQNADSIVKTIRNFEINEKQLEIHRGERLDEGLLKDEFGVKLSIPDSYYYAVVDANFIWIRKEIAAGSSNILLYEVPIDRIENNENKILNIIEVKDSIASLHVKGTQENSYMKSDGGFLPFNSTLILDHLKVIELKGTWNMKNSFMSGPYLCYAIKDEYFERYLIVEGFTYNPSISKRDLMFELEAIIKSISFHE